MVNISGFKQAFSLKKIQVGVFISPSTLALVMTGARQATSPRDLVKWECHALPENLHPETDRFSQFLKKCLTRFTGPQRKVSIWCAIDPVSLKIKHITIPDIPAKKIPGAAFWGLKRETNFDETREIFDFEVLDDIVVDGIKKKNILVFSGAGDQIQSLENIFAQAGYPLAGITAIPFAIQNFIRTSQMKPDAPYFAVTHISRENSEIYCFSRSGILLVRGLRTGTLDFIEEKDENSEMAQLVLTGEEQETPSSVSSQIQEMSERLVSKIMRTGDYCAQHYTGNTPINHYYFLGKDDEFAPVITLAEKMVPGGVRMLEPDQDTDTGIMRPDLPEKAKERSAVVIAFGIALSTDEITPNFICTTRDKAKKRTDRRIMRAVWVTGCLLLLACVAVNIYFTTARKNELARQALFSSEKAMSSNDISVADIEQIIKGAEKKLSRAEAYINRYRPLAVIFDLCHFTPSHIRLISLAYQTNKDKQTIAGKLQIEGKVTGTGPALEAELANYLLRLSTSPVFGNIEITKQHPNVGQSPDQLFFTATLEVF